MTNRFPTYEERLELPYISVLTRRADHKGAEIREIIPCRWESVAEIIIDVADDVDSIPVEILFTCHEPMIRVVPTDQLHKYGDAGVREFSRRQNQ